MLGLLWRLLVGRFTSCQHVWEIIESGQIKTILTGNQKGTYYILKCTKCGALDKQEYLV